MTKNTFVLNHFLLVLNCLISLDADVWKKFLSRPALPFILRLLRGLATQHPPTQVRNISNGKLDWSCETLRGGTLSTWM